MATFKIPSQQGIRQLGNGDLFGELWSTFNIDLHTSPGKIKLARPFKKVADATDLSDDRVEAFTIFEGDGYALTASELYEANSTYTSWSGVVGVTVSNAQDMVVFNGGLAISDSTDIGFYNGTTFDDDWWTNTISGTALSGGVPSYPHILEVIRIGAETLAVTDGNKVRAYTAGSGTIVTVDLDTAFTATCIKSGIRRVWIGTYSEETSEAYVFEWDGASTNYTQAFPVGAKAVLAMELVDGIPVIVTERGEIKMFNNAGFTTVAQFPFAIKPLFTDGVETGLIQKTNTVRPIHPKGMKRSGNTLFIYTAFEKINDDVSVDERTPAGLWALDLKTYSLTHLASPESHQHFQASSPLMVLNSPDARLFVGGRLNTSSDEEGIWIEDLSTSTANYGYFVTSEMQSESVQDIFEKVVLKALMNSTDEIVVKYRTARDVSLPLYFEGITWATSTTFHTTQDLSYVKTRFDAGHRDEVEITLGSGAGRLAHITNIEASSSTYVVTIDEAIGTTNETFDMRVDNWKKIPETYTATDGEFKSLGIGEPGTWAQLKVELRGKNGYPEIRDMIIKTNNKSAL